ncbi:hypothetical protein IV38_GL001695 [Lactobacillus selangorensis]|uniref:Uncharacterized protein n=1 Tax=Lactobacillus selangorensis TaxID=81857 RepID=A0A0R2FHX6_9LACO|nr:hypothetical protein [Lactobacillus selangorensis]KRN28241.1 hypothetical protein IV38_GL001695 [Lactobacillus selangorensis]KRN30883.1 hypothetical protein IV40_GL001520 [Lactobacillus selangorensis]
MATQAEQDQAFAKKLAALEKNDNLTILASMNQPYDGSGKMTQYVVYTDYQNDDRQQKTNSIFVYTPYENIDKYGHSKSDFQCQLLFELNHWDHTLHITVLETLGAESRLAFYDFQNLGLAQLALQALLNLARKGQSEVINGYISSFDADNLAKARHIFEKFAFTVTVEKHENTEAATFEKKRQA